MPSRSPTSLRVESWPIDRPIPYARNPRQNDASVDTVASSIAEFGFQQPIVVDTDGVILVGHTRLKAARKLGLETVPVVVARNLTPAQAKAYRIMDNRAGHESEWNLDLLKLEIEDLALEGFDLDLTGFDAKALEQMTGTPDGDEPGGSEGIDYQEHYAVLVECADEANQQEVFDHLVALGYTCKVLVN